MVNSFSIHILSESKIRLKICYLKLIGQLILKNGSSSISLINGKKRMLELLFIKMVKPFNKIFRLIILFLNM